MSFLSTFSCFILSKKNQREDPKLPASKGFSFLEFKKRGFGFKSFFALVVFSLAHEKQPGFKKKRGGIFSQNSRGFALILLLGFLPLFLSLFFSFRWVFVLLRAHHQAHFFCQKLLLQTQKGVLLELRKLFRLNPKARVLQIKHKRAKEKLKEALISGNPLFIAQAKVFLDKVEASQVLLNKRQEKHRQKAETLMLLYGEDLKEKFKKGGLPSPLNFFFSQKSLILKKSPSFSLSPVYSPPPFFTQKQALKASWTLEGKDFLPLDLKKWLNKLFPSPLLLKGDCGASLQREKEVWKSVLFQEKKF